MDKVAVAILNYNGKKHLEKFLPSVIKHSPKGSVWVIDNLSTDDSLDFLKADYPEVNLVVLDENGGYSRGYNLGLDQIKAEYFVLLNSDVEVTPNWTGPVIEMMDHDPSIAAVQPKILDYKNKDKFEYAGAGGGFIDTLGYPFCRGRLFLTLEEDRGQFDDTHRIFWASGACIFLRSSAYYDNQKLDEDFFAHMEEIDLCWRLNNAGLKVMYNGQSTVYHVGGGTLHKSNPRKTYLNFRNGLALLYKNYKTWELFIKFPIRLVLDLIAAFKFMIFDSLADGLAVLRAHIHFLFDLPENYKKRLKIKKRVVGGAAPPIYKRSIVYHYFVRGIRKYTDLPR
ncbi:glycosyltransferase family 2 protein [Fulvivirga lutimaris]|uniref:glycosyltransferase family 2 protein n=1 Tax=Fulvivirga lutimaris TaxID=1819566 RepID=UPI0012BBF53F|nr:glycosyltransferase family 2 protein [Fulvivirga lutimaris]MTI40932.1 glycosyltransferase family 2 protein [Fulvivirga lutimaris]